MSVVLSDLGIRESRIDMLTMSVIVGTNSAMHSFIKIILSQDVQVLRIHPDNSVHFYIEYLCGRQKNSF